MLLNLLLNKELQNSPEWELVPASIKEEYLRLLCLSDRSNKVLFYFDQPDLSPEETRNVFLLCTSRRTKEWRGLYVLLPPMWQKSYPVCFITYSGWKTIEETYSMIEKEGEYPHSFVDYSGKVNRF